jgi:LacI family transcriptional regulator
LNDRWKEHGISPATAQLIMSKAKELNYIRNEGARSLRARKTFTIGVVVRDITNTFYAQLVKFLEDALFRHGYTVIICNTGYDLDKESKHIKRLLRRRVDGIILSPVQKTGESVEDILLIKTHDVPLVLFDCRLDAVEADYVLVDNETGAYEAVKLLISLGHTKIAYVGGSPRDLNNQLRYAGYEKAHAEASLPLLSRLVRHGSYTAKHGHEAAKELINSPDKPTAFFAANNRIALGIYKATVESDLRVPDDVSIVGFDDFETATLLPSRLTVVRQPIPEMAQSVVELLLDRIDQSPEAPYVTRVLETELVVRDSTQWPRSTIPTDVAT